MLIDSFADRSDVRAKQMQQMSPDFKRAIKSLHIRWWRWMLGRDNDEDDVVTAGFQQRCSWHSRLFVGNVNLKADDLYGWSWTRSGAPKSTSLKLYGAKQLAYADVANCTSQFIYRVVRKSDCCPFSTPMALLSCMRDRLRVSQLTTVHEKVFHRCQ